MNYIISSGINILVCCLFFGDIFSMENQGIKKEIIKKSCFNREPISQICSSPNGEYLLENVSDDPEESQVHLWQRYPERLIKTFDKYNRGQFSPQSNYIIMYHETRNEKAIDIKPCLYAIKYDTLTPLIDTRSQYFSINSTGEYITTCAKLLHYNNEKNNLTNISLDGWGTIRGWHFVDESIIYATDEGKLIQRSLKSNEAISQQIDKNYSFLNVKGPIVSLLYDTFASLFLIKNNTIKKIREIKYDVCNYLATNLFIAEKEIMCLQTDNSSFDILDSNNKILGSFSGNDLGCLDCLVSNRTGNNIIAVYNFYNSKAYSPSTIVFFDLSQIEPQLQGTKITTDMTVKSINFINDNLILAQGTKTKIFDIFGKEIADLGESQDSDIQRNSIVTIYHTPFKAAETDIYAGDVCATTTISRHDISHLLK